MSIKEMKYKQFLQYYGEIEELQDEDLLSYIVNERCNELVAALHRIISNSPKKISAVDSIPTHKYPIWLNISLFWRKVIIRNE